MFDRRVASLVCLVFFVSSHALTAKPIRYSIASTGILKVDGTEYPQDELVLSFAGDTENVADGVIRDLPGTLRFGDLEATLDDSATIRLDPDTDTFTATINLAGDQGPVLHHLQNEIFVTIGGRHVFNLSTWLGDGPPAIDDVVSPVAGYDLKSDFSLAALSGFTRPTDFAGQMQHIDWYFTLSTSTSLGPITFLIGDDFATGPSEPLSFTFSSVVVPEPSTTSCAAGTTVLILLFRKRTSLSA